MVADLNYFLALGTIALQVVGTLLLIAYCAPRLMPGSETVRAFIGKWGIPFALLLILATAAVNFYYESLGFEPCPLCWWQRVFLYPQAVLFALAVWKSEYVRAVVDSALVLSFIGAGIALYQHALQMLGEGSLPCPATGVSCAQRIVFEFGYITYPLMAFSLFALLILVMLVVRSRRAS